MGELKQKASKYSEAFDGASPLADIENRRLKAHKISAVLREEGAFRHQAPTVLDIGCSRGLILAEVTPADGLGVGVDLDGSVGRSSENVSFLTADAERLPLISGSVDIVICNHVYEHTDRPEFMVAEIDRVLRATGVCYFAGPNKFDVVEPHYGLPFLSWLPRSLADRYLRLSGRGSSYAEKPYSRSALLGLLQRFDISDYTARIVNDPVRYAATDILPPGSLKQWIARAVLRLAPKLFPGFVFVLRKKPGAGC